MADLMISKGPFNHCTLKNYWLKGESYHDKVLSIKKELFEKPSEMINTYTIGVYGIESTHFSILFLDNFNNVIRIHY